MDDVEEIPSELFLASMSTASKTAVIDWFFHRVAIYTAPLKIVASSPDVILSLTTSTPLMKLSLKPEFDPTGSVQKCIDAKTVGDIPIGDQIQVMLDYAFGALTNGDCNDDPVIMKTDTFDETTVVRLLDVVFPKKNRSTKC